MSEATQGQRTPMHLWIVGVLALVWNSVGAFDYLMTETRNAEYMSQFTPEQLAYFYGFPTWAIATWAISVWGGVLGAVLLLLRKRLAVGVFLASLLAMALTTIYMYGLSDGFAAMSDPFSQVFSGLIVVIAVALLIYARRMAAAGVLT